MFKRLKKKALRAIISVSKNKSKSETLFGTSFLKIIFIIKIIKSENVYCFDTSSGKVYYLIVTNKKC